MASMSSSNNVSSSSLADLQQALQSVLDWNALDGSSLRANLLHALESCSWRAIRGYAVEFWATVGPGGKLHPAAFLEHKGHLFIEGILIAVIVGLFLQTNGKPKARGGEESLTQKEMDQLVKEWEPEPLVPELPAAAGSSGQQSRVLERLEDQHVIIKGQRVLNLTATDYLGLRLPDVLDKCSDTIQKYGVGACGPRGFYGTLDVHLDLEAHLTRFMGTEESIIYSFDIATVASIIPAFANRKDLLLVDEECAFPIQQGCNLSRARVLTFRHNDMQHLEELMLKVEAQDRRDKRPLYRRFVVVEGIFNNSGDLAPLDELFRLKEQYRYRLLVEESHSFGVLGKQGRGACEHFGLQPGRDVEVVCASMGNALASMGGFCSGSVEVVDHQRLSSSGYVFSAALPPYLATGASGALSKLESHGPQLRARLHSNIAALRQLLADVPGLRLVGTPDCPSPLIHLRLQDGAPKCATPDEERLRQLADRLLSEHRILVAVHRVSFLDQFRPPCSLKLLVTAALTRKDLEKAAAAIKLEAASLLVSPSAR